MLSPRISLSLDYNLISDLVTCLIRAIANLISELPANLYSFCICFFLICKNFPHLVCCHRTIRLLLVIAISPDLFVIHVIVNLISEYCNGFTCIFCPAGLWFSNLQELSDLICCHHAFHFPLIVIQYLIL